MSRNGEVVRVSDADVRFGEADHSATRCCLGLLLLVIGCNRPPADSTAPEFGGAEDRIAWMEDRLREEPPSPIVDAHFADKEMKVKHGHMGPGYSMHWFHARIEIDPKNADAWAAATPEATRPNWTPDSSPMADSTATWAMPPEEFNGASWYDPAPLFGDDAHGGYEAGAMAINEAGDAVYVWQHWR